MENRTLVNNPFEFEKCSVAVGRVLSEIDFDILVPLFSKIKKPYHNLQLLFLGQVKERIEKQLAALELKVSVFLLGFAASVYPFFNHAYVCVAPFRIEGFQNALFQLTHQNNTVVSTKCTSSMDQINNVFSAVSNEAASLKKAMINRLRATTTSNTINLERFLNEKGIDFFFKSQLF